MFRFEVLMDRRENLRKCTIHPLRSRIDFRVRRFGSEANIPPFSASCLLHVEGQCLSKISPAQFPNLAVLDCHWKRVPSLLRRIAHPLPPLVSFPRGFSTAYPRKNQEGKDPEGGLATIEALFIANAFLGKWDETLLDQYYFKQEFLSANRKMFESYGIHGEK
jgi:pre-rRNA-processing protein TSR3